ncbi:MAG: aminotransferase class III-fold pyridoxal phosphate-dependent enzyme [Kaiparowitsia implicata GSE-PSE-MK54-09C]|jgi:glutamate-1-semialdehyde 2,1-aminomutase|nr:aminotransferase class III-fold pyridoxal phosphate-dependent enzyme [Kaiparowitsia implicata GSE-PSE-MK54-09C]
MPKVVAIVQARMSSTRLPGKVMQTVAGMPMIEVLIRRLARSTQVDQIMLATSTNPANDPLAQHVGAMGYPVWRGSENDVLARFHDAANSMDAEIVVRITGDCPLVDAGLVDAVVQELRDRGADYATNTMPPTFPDGMDVEVFTFPAMVQALRDTDDAHDHEHVTPYMRNAEALTRVNLSNDEDLSAWRWTVDEVSDLQVVRSVFEHFGGDIHFSWRDVVALRRTRPDLFAANTGMARNEGAKMGTGQKLWRRAKQIIPGGSMLLSKRAEMFAPDQWPAYFSRAKGCSVWDLDGREYIDMSLMGIGTNTLGYGHPEVDEAVIETVHKGNMSTLNCPEEVELAERLIAMHGFADMARFTRSGGEANAVAIRIARAATGRDKVAICGYHGWHDWYLSTNLSKDDSLKNHLLPGLDPAGVPRDLAGSTLPFNYNDLAALEQLVAENQIAAIKMEVVRNRGPQDGFLHKVRDIATRHDIVLIFDECTSGFRASFGGLHKNYDVEPDMAVFGKTLGNGYAINAVIGSEAVMQAAQSTFISSTFWTERIGPSAAVRTLQVMEREKSWERITAQGAGIKQGWQTLADKHGLRINISGLDALATYGFEGPGANSYKTLVTQEMLGKGYLAGTGVYSSLAHTPEVIAAYFEALDPVFALIAECENGRDVKTLLQGPLAHTGFARLN